MSVFERELADMEKISGIRIDHMELDGDSLTAAMTVVSNENSIVRTYSKPEPLKMEMWHWMYLWSLAATLLLEII